VSSRLNESVRVGVVVIDGVWRVVSSITLRQLQSLSRARWSIFNLTSTSNSEAEAFQFFTSVRATPPISPDVLCVELDAEATDLNPGQGCLGSVNPHVSR
jgi:hypothetical protein